MGCLLWRSGMSASIGSSWQETGSASSRCYAGHAGLLLFASEPKALLAYPGFPRVLDPVALDQYLTYQYVPTPRCIYAGMRKLRPGHSLVVESGHVTEHPYWELDLSPRTTP